MQGITTTNYISRPHTEARLLIFLRLRKYRPDVQFAWNRAKVSFCSDGAADRIIRRQWFYRLLMRRTLPNSVFSLLRRLRITDRCAAILT